MNTDAHNAGMRAYKRSERFVREARERGETDAVIAITLANIAGCPGEYRESADDFHAGYVLAWQESRADMLGCAVSPDTGNPHVS